MKIIRNISFAIILFIVMINQFGCKKNKNTDSETNPNLEVNNWILENMQDYYYWNSKIPTKPDLTLKPDLFFESLLNTPTDRFSWIQDNYVDLMNSLSGVEKSFGFEFQLYLMYQGSNQLIAQIIYVEKGGPADKAGIRRGDLFISVNNQYLTIGNYQTVFSAADTWSIGEVVYQNNSFVNGATISVTKDIVNENPLVLDSVYTIGNKKVGYFFYKSFISDNGDESNKYNLGMEKIFQKFKANGISDLVLDLRMNRGGAESCALKLASLIVKNLNTNNVFARKEYNTDLGNYILQKYGESALKIKFTNETNNIGNTLNRLYVLTSQNTASASELIINGLKPYMDVILIGDSTAGKNLGSFSIYDETGEIKWGMQPIVLKIFNSLDKSDYDNGFGPDILNRDNVITLYPFGDINENLLNIALSVISQNVKKKSVQRFQQKEIYNSLSRNPLAFNLYVNNDFLDFKKKK